MRRSADIDALGDVLSAALGFRVPVCSIAELGQSAEAFAALPRPALARPTLVGGGAPYSPTSPAPTAQALDALVRRAKERDVPQILVPNVRRSDDTSALREAGFHPMAVGSECVVRLPGEVDETLRTRVGAGRLGELRRRHHTVARELSWERVRLSELGDSPWARDAFAALHRRQVERQGGRHNPYNAEALHALAGSALADRTELLIRRRPDNSVVQAGLLTNSHNGRGLYHLAQAVDHEDPVARRGLNEASLYALYLDARRSGLEWVHLGRGDADHTRRLGADLFVPLDHWLRGPDLPPPGGDEEDGAEPALSAFAAPGVSTVPVPGPARFRHRPRFDLLDLSSNTNPFLGAESTYPELDTAELARIYLATISKLPGHAGAGGLSADHLLFTSGAVDGVMLLLAALASPGQRVCVTPPTFELYAHFARVQGLSVVEVPLKGDDLSGLDVDRILAADPRVTMLCDPNNPVGTRLDPAQVNALVAGGRGLVVIDEAYVEFSEHPSYAELVDRHENLIVLRTLSKAWGLAGARCGIALAHPGLIDALRRVQVPFGFTNWAQRTVRDRLTNAEEALASVQRIRAERDRMAAALAEHPAVDRVFPSETNFLLARLHKHERVMDQLRGAGILVADTGHLVPATCRISIGTRRANTILLEELSAAL
ncbi:aminotransferase class I/II-fold pyridoxal phosphate-dependent enzyme [Streptomyces oryzae]|uniref:histidinol-phosphate transaminase n=1 Tax=Streptomyces oryzae TaxID=1434886 RepID=A0ABS3X7Z1_9ACTN|nr:aminotransferase class I/II-fold pyridoxal phosphate-dependent enzyme [Streptomyces oryzae]MBO8191454.1 aminotransferase class I/II-fold pyridoxal phosphate-dependent enzyme [Streptomyces oryzae]